MPKLRMNWLDIVLLIILGSAAWKGFQRGFLIELASLAGLVLGIWAGIHLHQDVTEALDLDIRHEAIAFLITFAIVIGLVVLLGHLLTKIIDIAQLSLPNKVAGIAFGVLRSAFALSIAMNLIVAFSEGRMPPPPIRTASVLCDPISAFAPLVVPALNDAKWIARLKADAEETLREHGNR